MTSTPALVGRQAVLDALPDHPAVKAILAWNDSSLTDARFEFDELTLTVPREQIRAASETMRQAGYNFFEDMTAVDWFPATPRFQLSYHLLSHSFKERIRLRVIVGEADAAIDSITTVWPAANFYEREVFDLFGIQFNGHPDLRRIMMPDDWKGHPLRKDYPVEGPR
jgi:NADH-quinone oxidoreductase subunit C